MHGFIVLEIGGGFDLPDVPDRSFDALVGVIAAGVQQLAGARE